MKGRVRVIGRCRARGGEPHPLHPRHAIDLKRRSRGKVGRDAAVPALRVAGFPADILTQLLRPG